MRTWKHGDSNTLARIVGPLQWGHVRENVETSASAVSLEVLTGLQWGHVRENVETFPPYCTAVYILGASMGPRS